MTNTNPPPEPDNTPRDSNLSSGSPPEATLRAALEERIMDVGISYHLGKSQPRDFRDSVLAALELRRTEAALDPDLLEPAQAAKPARPRRLFAITAYAAATLLLAAVIASPFLDFSGGNQANNGGALAGAPNDFKIVDGTQLNPQEDQYQTQVIASSMADLEAALNTMNAESVGSIALYGKKLDDKALGFSVESFKNLNKVSLLDCNISDEGLAVLGELTELRSLELHQCRRITNKGVETIGDLSNLEVLGITSFVGQRASISGVEDEEAKDNWGDPGSRLSDECWKGIVKLKKLRWLRMTGSRIGDQFLLKLALEGSEQLKSLFLDDTLITDRNLALFHTPLEHGDGIPASRLFPKLTELDIRNAKIGDKGIEDFVRFIEDSDQYPEMKDRSSIEKLTIGGDGFNSSQITGKGLAMLAKLPMLKSLMVQFASYVNDNGYATGLAGCNGLEQLSLNRVSGFGTKTMQALGKLPNLWELVVYYSPGLDNEGLKALKVSPSLRQLQLSGSSSLLDEAAISEVWHALTKARGKPVLISLGENQDLRTYSPNYLRLLANEPRTVLGTEVDAFVLDANGICLGKAAKFTLAIDRAAKWEGPNSEAIHELAEASKERSDKVGPLSYYDLNLSAKGKHTIQAYDDKHGKLEHAFDYEEGRYNVALNWPSPKRTGRPNPADYFHFSLKATVTSEIGVVMNQWYIVIHKADMDNNHNSTAVFGQNDVENENWAGRSKQLRWQRGGEALQYTLYFLGKKPLTGTIPDNAYSEVVDRIYGPAVKRNLITLNLVLPDKE